MKQNCIIFARWKFLEFQHAQDNGWISKNSRQGIFGFHICQLSVITSGIALISIGTVSQVTTTHCNLSFLCLQVFLLVLGQKVTQITSVCSCCIKDGPMSCATFHASKRHNIISCTTDKTNYNPGLGSKCNDSIEKTSYRVAENASFYNGMRFKTCLFTRCVCETKFIIFLKCLVDKTGVLQTLNNFRVMRPLGLVHRHSVLGI